MRLLAMRSSTMLSTYLVDPSRPLDLSSSSPCCGTLSPDMPSWLPSKFRLLLRLCFTQKQIRMFFRLQRLTVYFAKLLESEAHPLWALDDPIDPRNFARQVAERSVSYICDPQSKGQNCLCTRAGISQTARAPEIMSVGASSALHDLFK